MTEPLETLPNFFEQCTEPLQLMRLKANNGDTITLLVATEDEEKRMLIDWMEDYTSSFETESEYWQQHRAL